MQTPLVPLFDPPWQGDPRKALLGWLVEERERGAPIVGVYCSYAPAELVWAMGGAAAGLCGASNGPIAAAHAVLPTNLCPLIKSSYGFIVTGTCPFFELSDAVIAETTCDGKKKMFELVRDRKPLHMLHLPNVAGDPESLELWTSSVRRMSGFLERTFGRGLEQGALEAAIVEANARRALTLRALAYAADDPPRLDWEEAYALATLGTWVRGEAGAALLTTAIARLEERRRLGQSPAVPGAPRVLVTGCPVQGDAAKVFRLIQEAGGAVVAQDSCTGLKPLLYPVTEGSSDPVGALARRYLEIPCSVMSPNDGRTRLVDELIERYRPDAVVDVVLQFCHTYSIESHTLEEHVRGAHGLPFLKLETDYSQNDLGQLRTRVEALLEMARG